MSKTQSRLLCAVLVLIALLPLWVGRYPPLFDYPAHLLEAQVYARYSDPGLGYAEGYRLNRGWPRTSNALATLINTGLALALPIELAGKIVLSLCLVLFISGLWRLLQRSHTTWPLLLLGPPLAWNSTFTSGWVNFALGLALGLHLLASFLSWSDNLGHRRAIAMIALLSGLIATAHPFAWALWALISAALAATHGLDARRSAVLLAALCLPLAMALSGSPTLATALALIPPLTWLVAWVARRISLSPATLCIAALPIAIGGYALAYTIEPWLRHLDPEISYDRFARTSFLLRTFTLAQQANPPDPLIDGVNMLMLSLFGLLGLVLISSALRRPQPDRSPWLAALAALIVLYGISPSGAADFQLVEPRILIVAALLSLAHMGTPQARGMQRLSAGLAAALCMIWLVGACQSTLDYNRRALVWQADLALLGPARRVLAFRAADSPPDRPNRLLNLISSRYDGSFFSAYRVIEYGGYTTRLFGNGPIWLRDEVPGWIFYRPQPTDAPGHLADQCRLAKASFDAVLLWGSPDAELTTMLNNCLGPPARRNELLIWATK